VTRLAEPGARVALNQLPGDPAGAAVARLGERGLEGSALAGDVAKPRRPRRWWSRRSPGSVGSIS